MSQRSQDRRAELLERAIRLKKAAPREGPSQMPPRPAEEPSWLGEMQQSLWLVHQLEPDSAAYNLASASRISGTLDMARLQEAFSVLLARHRILRSTFSLQENGVRQIIHDPAPLAIERLEVDPGQELQVAVEQARRPFDLEEGPLVRFLSIEETSGQSTLLLLILHHVLADERSLGILWRELGEAYEGRLSDTADRLQYDDFVHWQRRCDPAERRQGLDYWRQKLEPLPEDLDLPFAAPTDAAAGAQGRLLRRNLGPSVQSGIRRLAAATGASPFMVYCFAFRLLLQRYTSGQRFALATPVSNRPHPATVEMVGYFLNPVVLDTIVDEEQTVEQAIRGFSQDLRGALAHASVPFHELAEALSPPRQTDRHPIFQTMFVHQESAKLPVFGGLACEPVTLDLGVSKFDLTLFVTEAGGSAETSIEYRADRFERNSMERLLEHYCVLIEGLAQSPAATTAQVPMLPAHEIEQLEVISQGATLVDSDIDLLPRQILEQARRGPETPALVCAGIHRSYAQLESAARSIAAKLVEKSVKTGDRVAIFIDRSTALIEAVVGCHLAGSAYVPLDPGYPKARNRQVLEDAQVAAVLTTSALKDRVSEGSWPTLEVDRLAATDADTTPPLAIDPGSPAYLLYTSGSTGRPKGVVVSHGNLRASTAARLQIYDTQPRRFLLLPSLAFDSSVAGLFWTLGTGDTLVVPTDEQARDPRQLCQLVRDERVTALLCVPSLYTQILRTDSTALQDLEMVIVAGESCPSPLVAEHFRCLPQARFYNEYGPTEATVWATVHEATRDDADRPVAVGRPIPGVRIDLLDDLGRRVPEGIPGYAWISGPTVAQGYWQRPELTDESFVTDTHPQSARRRYRTGDRMAWTADGRLLFLGRQDEQIKIRGFRIEPGDIEAALVELDAVREAAVVPRAAAGARGSTGLGPTLLIAFVEVTTDEAVVGWRERLADRLPDYMIPNRLVSLPALPRLPNGKIDRQRLRSLELEPEAAPREESPLLDTRAQALISLWEGLLARPGIGLDDNFFELGGHSLLVVELTLAIERDLGVSLTAADVFEHPTIRQLLGALSGKGDAKTPPYQHLYPIQPLGQGSPFVVAIPHFFTEMLAQRFRGERPVYGLRGVGLRAEGNLGRWRTMRELGEELVEEIERRFPDTPCFLAGYSFGASMAVEVARLMEERGSPARQLYLIAPMPVDTYRLGPLRLQLDGLRRSPVELSTADALRLYLRANQPWTRRPYQRAWRWLLIEPWRRLLCSVGKLRRRLGLPLTPRILWADVRVDRFRLHANYRPLPIRTPTVIFNAEDTETDAAATWRPFFQGPFTVQPTSDPHRGEESVDASRRLILDHLEDLET